MLKQPQLPPNGICVSVGPGRFSSLGIRRCSDVLISLPALDYAWYLCFMKTPVHRRHVIERNVVQWNVGTVNTSTGNLCSNRQRSSVALRGPGVPEDNLATAILDFISGLHRICLVP